ncbi:MAG: ECF transporter S component [Treponema sp.]|nr:ECF transporter S component [Treponema sp.]
MNEKKRLFPSVKIHPAVIAVWAALVAAAHIVPAIPILGTGSNFTLAAALTPLSGIMFGPIAGALCSAAGGFIGSLVAPHTAWMGLGTFLIGTATAFTSGCIAWGNWPPVSLNAKGSLVVNGGIIVYLIGTLLWFSQETGRGLVLFPLVYYSAGFAALIAGGIFAGKVLKGKNRVLKFPVLWLCAFGGMIGGATIGNFFSLILYQIPRSIWLGLVFAAPLERAIFSLGTALIGVPLLLGLEKTGIFLGPRDDNNETGGQD